MNASGTGRVPVGGCRRAVARWAEIINGARRSLIRVGGEVVALSLLIILIATSSPVSAQVADVTISNVTVRAFSISWLFDEEIIDAAVKIFEDEDGTIEITNSVTIEFVSETAPSAHSRGIAMFDVSGVAPDTTYFVQIESTGPSGTDVFPLAAPLLAVTTPVRIEIANTQNQAIINDLVGHQVLDLGGGAPDEGALVVLDVPGVSQYPLAAFIKVTENSGHVVFDLNNIFDASAFQSVEVPDGTLLELTTYRGLTCNGIGDQKLIQQRRVFSGIGVPATTEAFPAAPCYAPDNLSVDWTCDDRIGVGDLVLFLAEFELASTAEQPNCDFHPDFDLTSDQRIGVGDLVLFLSVLDRQKLNE